VALLVEHVRSNYEHSFLFGIGFSMGGNFLTRYLMDHGKVSLEM
jgi:predicted alpha/beta-fold hydrolase